MADETVDADAGGPTLLMQPAQVVACTIVLQGIRGIAMFLRLRLDASAPWQCQDGLDRIDGIGVCCHSYRLEYSRGALGLR